MSANPKTTTRPRCLGLKKGLTHMYREGMLCDATLIADGERFSCHRALLAAISPYFREVFVHTWKKSNGGEVLIQDVAPSVIQSILKYIYTDEIALTLERMPQLMAGASQLQIVPLQDTCCRFLLKNLSVKNWLQIYSLAYVHQNHPLLQAIIQFLVHNFELIFEKDQFLELDSNILTAVISSDDLPVTSEFKVYQFVRRWVNSQPNQRKPLLGDLMQNIRFPLFTAEEQTELQKDVELWGDLNLKWKEVDCDERLQLVRKLRCNMYKPYILCIDTQLCENEDGEVTEVHMGCYEPQSEIWEKLPGLPFLTHACCASAGNKVYISGGIYQNSYSSAVYEFCAFTNQWLQLPNMSTPRTAHGFLFWDQMLYAMGGWDNFQSFLSSAESFDLVTGKWNKIPKLPFALNYPAAIAYRNKLYLVGGAIGYTTEWLLHEGFFIYEISSSTWCKVSLHRGFFATGVVVLDNRICCFGGYFRRKSANRTDGAPPPETHYSSRKCFFLNEVNNSFYIAGTATNGLVVPKLTQGIANAGVVYCGKKVYILGGDNVIHRFKTIYHWLPGEPNWRENYIGIPMSGEGISRFGCAVLMRPLPQIFQLFQDTSQTIVAATSI